MKKLLVLMLVLGLVSAANATTLKISVNGVIDPCDSTITIPPSDEVLLDIHCLDYSYFPFAFYWALVCDTAYGTIDYVSGQMNMPPAPDYSTYDSKDWGVGAAEASFPGLLPGEDGSWGSIGSPATTVYPGIYYQDIVFRCEAEGDALIRLIGTGDFIDWYLFDTQVIHQVPEPASMLLLGLGGLALTMRGKKVR